MNRKTLSQNAIQINEQTIDASYLYLTSLNTLSDKNIINREHFASLVGGGGHYRSMDKVLSEWLGLNEKVEMIDSIDQEFEQMEIDDNQSNFEQDNEEQEEEDNRRDDIDSDEEFYRSAKVSSKFKFISPDDADEPGEWQTVVNKGKQKHIIHQLLTLPTKLTDEKVASIRRDLWSLTTPQRHDLYRYWLKKYRESGYQSVSDAHVEFNRAMTEHSQYLQLEDYYILKNAIIVAMTTTCAAKYFDVLQKLGN